MQPIFQTYQHLLLCAPVEYVWFPQRYGSSARLRWIATVTDVRTVSDVFHTGSPDSALWEFKHGNGNFRRGDLVGLREIKRRASRHTLINRDNYSGQKSGVSQPGTPAEAAPDSSENMRLTNLEHQLYEMHNRLLRVEESQSLLSSRCQAMADCLVKCHQVSYAPVLAKLAAEYISGPITSLKRLR